MATLKLKHEGLSMIRKMALLSVVTCSALPKEDIYRFLGKQQHLKEDLGATIDSKSVENFVSKLLEAKHEGVEEPILRSIAIKAFRGFIEDVEFLESDKDLIGNVIRVFTDIGVDKEIIDLLQTKQNPEFIAEVVEEEYFEEPKFDLDDTPPIEQAIEDVPEELDSVELEEDTYGGDLEEDDLNTIDEEKVEKVSLSKKQAATISSVLLITLAYLYDSYKNDGGYKRLIMHNLSQMFDRSSNIARELLEKFKNQDLDTIEPPIIEQPAPVFDGFNALDNQTAEMQKARLLRENGGHPLQ